MAQFLSVVVPSANAVPAVNGSGVQIASLSLPPGNWILAGEAWIEVSAGSPTVARVAAQLAPSTTMLTNPAENAAAHVQEPAQPRSAEAQVGFVLPLTGVHANIQQTTTFYLYARMDWTGTGTITIMMYGKINAARPDFPMYYPS